MHGIPEAILHVPLIFLRPHIDEIDNDQAAKVAQTQLPGNLLRRFHIGGEGGGLDVAALGCPGGVDVDRYQCFGVVDDYAAAGG